MSTLSNIRRAQLISPFGPGALVVLRNGLSVVVAGLDHWYCSNDDSSGSRADRNEFKFREWRLERKLGLDYLMLPPDFRRRPRHGPAVKNSELPIPSLRFPTWHFCRFCNRMHQVSLTTEGDVTCPSCASTKGKRPRMAQVRFVALCENGHLQDFPWIEWVHKSAAPTCRGPLSFESKGGSTLGSIFVRCESCKRERSLARITEDSPPDESFVSQNLDESGSRFRCQGARPWLGQDKGCDCQKPLVGGLRSATNLHFGDVESAIYLPIKLLASPGSQVAQIVSILREPEHSDFISIIKELHRMNPAYIGPIMTAEAKKRPALAGFADADLSVALSSILGASLPGASVASTVEEQSHVAEDDDRTAFRRVEFNVLSHEQDDVDLRVRPARLDGISDTSLRGALESIHLVHKLRETRVFTGFSRRVAGGGLSTADKVANLRLEQPPEGERWLPGYVVYGEGIFIRLNEKRLSAWEKRTDVRDRISGLRQRELDSAIERGRQSERVSPRLVLVHTLAHLLINRLTFECGYSSAALRERLFVSENEKAPMAGLLIYTASGDSEGSMGGLVRMGEPSTLERILRKAIEDSRWCSNDPVCMESATFGQGPESLNLAACHSCALLPETACEKFNRLLDRGLVVGSFEKADLGFFHGCV